MKAKTFVILIISAFVAAICVLFTTMKIANSINSRGNDWKSGKIHSIEPLLREEKALYIGQKDISYDSFVVGGSKAGFLKKERLDFYSGGNFYNFFATSGGFRDYDLYINYLIRKHEKNIKEIILHLSTYEANAYSYGDYIPIPMQSNIFGKISSIFKICKSMYLNIDLFSNYAKKWLNNGKEDYAISEYGDYIMTKSVEEFSRDSDSYVKKYVLPITKDSRELKYLFEDSSLVSKSVCKKNITTLSRLKKLCDDNEIKLTIVIGAHWIGRLSNIWGDTFNQYLKDLISVNGSIWDFSGINTVNMNPYNFFNDGHFWDFVGDKMIETMYEGEPNTSDMNAFGILLNKDNIDAYIESQREKWLALKAEYDATGTIQLQGKSDKSYLGQ